MKKKIRLVLIILVMIWMAVIFILSSRPASLSSRDSYRVGKLYAELFVPDFKKWPPESQDKYIRSINRPIRKAAHAGEYAILAMLIGGVFIVQAALSSHNDIKMARHLIKGVLCSALFACTDEFHQLFVKGRGGSLLDICIDTAGALVGVFFLGVTIYICQRLVALIRKGWTSLSKQSESQI